MYKPVIIFSVVLSSLVSFFAHAAGERIRPTRVVFCSSQETVRGDNASKYAVDGDPGTIWHTTFKPHTKPHPHEMVVDLGRSMAVSGLFYLPRQDGENGSVAAYAWYLSEDGDAWTPAAGGTYPASVLKGAEQRTLFKQALTGRFLKFVALTSYNKLPFTSVAELGAFTGNPAEVPLLTAEDRGPERAICFTLYTVQDGVLKLSAQLYPDRSPAETPLQLQIQEGDAWKTLAEARAHPPAWNAVFRVTEWDSSQDANYRVRLGAESYGGRILHDPVEKETITVAAFTGNSPGPGGGKISKRDVTDNVLKLNPDFLAFTGDQVYDHNRHTAHWLKFGEDFGDLTRNYPSVCLPDDHDVGQPNLWGGGGRHCRVDVEGGYTKPAAYVKMVERQQTSHMPDPYDPTPIEQGINVYYTSINIGGVDFAVIEDRKFKSGCMDFEVVKNKMGSRSDHIQVEGVDPMIFDVPGKELLGKRQEEFLEAWGLDWKGAKIKCVISQTLFTMASTHHGGGKTFYYADFDANGWPQTGRNTGVDLLRKCFAFHICGDQHLSTVVQYGIDDWRDGGWGFCVPSIANLWPRWWEPKTNLHGDPTDPDRTYTGDYLDGFGNKITMRAHTNPYKTGRTPAEFHDRMPGFGVVYFNKTTREISMHCWPRMVDPTDPASQQYRGWPITIKQTDNYGRPATAWLPELTVSGMEDPVVIVEDAKGERVYSLRIAGKTWQPGVFAEGPYQLKVGEPESKRWKTLQVKAAGDAQTAGKLELSF